LTAIWRQAVAKLQASPSVGLVVSGQDPHNLTGRLVGAAASTSPFPAPPPIPVPGPGILSGLDSTVTVRDS
jgi:hypothetical protein